MTYISSSTPRTPAETQAVDVGLAHHDFLDRSSSSLPGDAIQAVGGTQAGEISGLKIGVVEGGLDGITLEERAKVFEPLLFAAALASGPHVTRHHYHHAFGNADSLGVHDIDWSSKQAPRSFRRLSDVRHSGSSSPTSSPELRAHSGHLKESFTPLSLYSSHSYETPSLSPTSSVSDLGLNDTKNAAAADATAIVGDHVQNGEASVRVRCMVRTRVPTPHGEVFLHLYHNNRDQKEHLAIVVDPAQLDAPADGANYAKPIRSRSLDDVWDGEDSEMDRVIRGAYLGRLSEVGFKVSSAQEVDSATIKDGITVPAPLVRIHSECFTGETIGSMRCDCGEQLDEAIRRIAEPTTVTLPSGEVKTIPGRGAVVYMRQEGRGIGLLSKLRAYNLQDLGYDTVQANLMLGHGADERSYDVAAAIMRDLGLGAGEGAEEVQLLTNNPDKVQKLESAGVRISERVSMVPRTWRCQGEDQSPEPAGDLPADATVGSVGLAEDEVDRAARLRSAGATLIGASMTRGPELEKYLRTKVLRMGHMLSLPPSENA